ncbi:enoyl-CoA hydratase/isomerase family protein [Streptomyces chlorus]|uniref:Enoyl-CoA hydratase/isomerase family protein n=1 Tax=Streptomyces chlorus TaxID=887452 RepID=A0ABW1E103_9ACTN
MSDEPAVLTTKRGRTAVLELNRPRRRNALDLQDRRDLIAALDAAAEDLEVVSIVLTGAGPMFSAGGDIKSMPTDPEIARVRLRVLTELVNRMVKGPKPIISAVEGGAFGLGLSLVAATDFVVASREARFAASFGRLGLVPDTGLFWTLPRRIGAARAKELMLLTNDFTAQEADAMGLVTELVDAGSALDRALELAERLAQGSPAMYAETKALCAQPEQDLASVLESEAEAQVRMLATDFFSEAQEKFFKR